MSEPVAMPPGRGRVLCARCGGVNPRQAPSCRQCGQALGRGAGAVQAAAAAVAAAAPAPAPAQAQLHGAAVEAGTYRVEREVSVVLNGVTLALPRGKLLDDPGLIKLLLAQSAPLARLPEDARLVQCPDCGGVFEASAQSGA